MLGKDNKAKQGKHWIKTLAGKWRGGTHLLLWVDERMTKGRIHTDGVWAYLAICGKDGAITIDGPSDARKEKLEQWIEAATLNKGTLTIWLPEGWEHLVLSGLADLIDSGAITWRYCNIDGRRLILRGAWRGKSIVITTLTAWTGGQWDEWRGKADLEGAELFVQSWRHIAELSKMLCLGSVAPSAGAAGLLAWRSWLGPVVTAGGETKAKGKQGKIRDADFFVAPIPSRPEKAQASERHCCYGLVVRQLRKGLVNEETYCVDATSMYLTALCSMPVPIMHTATLHRPSIEELARSLYQHTGTALVCIRSETQPYPCRRNGRNLWSTGEFWTWLSGTELAYAVFNSHITQCESAHLWLATRLNKEVAESALTLSSLLEGKGEQVKRAAWRSMYSQLVGRFAAWRREWKDTPPVHQFGRWSSWLQADQDTGKIVTHRSIAGRCQRQTAREDTGDSVPLMFACVTSQARFLMSRMVDTAQLHNVVAIEADSVWVTRQGWQNLQRLVSSQGVSPDMVKVKAINSRTWLTGEHVAVVERQGELYIVSPGVPADIAVGRNGRVEWLLAMDWHVDGDPSARRGVKRSLGSMDAGKIIASVPNTLQVLPYSDRVSDPMLGEELLTSLAQQRRTVEDE